MYQLYFMFRFLFNVLVVLYLAFSILIWCKTAADIIFDKKRRTFKTLAYRIKLTLFWPGLLFSETARVEFDQHFFRRRKP